MNKHNDSDFFWFALIVIAAMYAVFHMFPEHEESAVAIEAPATIVRESYIPPCSEAKATKEGTVCRAGK
jgi:hypothetical protein